MIGNYCQIRLLTILSVVILIHVGQSVSLLPGLDDDQAWEAWKAKHGKTYASSEEEASRRELWTRTVEEVTRHNKAFNEGFESYSQAVYEWADQDISLQTDENDLSLYNWSTSGFVNDSQQVIFTKAPDEIDYRTMDYVTPVDNQGKCNSHWAFSAVGAIEALAKKTTNRLEKLSAQQIIDCNREGHDCRKGSMIDAMAYAKQYGLQTSCDYPYVGNQQQTCQYSEKLVAFEVKSYMVHLKVNETQLKDYIARYGPGVTHIAAPPVSFMNYQGGIYSPKECYNAKAAQSILIVGYGTSEREGKDYWIVKNSYGLDWGEQGYMRLERNVGLCQIGTYVVWPSA